MYKFNEPFITPTTQARTLQVKAFEVRVKDIYQKAANSFTSNTFGYNIQQGVGNAHGLKAILPGQATIAGIFLQNVQLANATGTGITGTLRIGKALPVLGISQPNSSTTATVYCQYAHGLTTGDTVIITDCVAVVQGTGATYATPATFNNCTPTTVNTISTNAIGGSLNGTKVSYAVTPDATDPCKFTFTTTATSSAAIQCGAIGSSFGVGAGPSLGTLGLVVADQYFGAPNVNTGGIATGFQVVPSLRNVGVFASQNTTVGAVAGYWQVAPGQPLGYTTTPGTPAVWCVSNALSATLGSDGNYNYFVEPTQDVQIFSYFQSTVTSGSVTDPTLGGPWVVFIYYFV